MMIYSWSIAYVTAVREWDLARLPDKIVKAERAILQRSQEPGLELPELYAMAGAVASLQTLLNNRIEIVH